MGSELFGHERGSFTGADRRHEGCFEAANGGTLLLDELTEMKSQAKLLRVIEERRVRPVGGAMEVPIDVRVLAASNRDIERAVRDGLLRADLYYRLNVFTLHLLPLRERLEDLPQLIQMFVEQYATRNHKDVIGADEECVQALHPTFAGLEAVTFFTGRAAAIRLCGGCCYPYNKHPFLPSFPPQSLL
jgi:two-component system response regulator PilR (NtrC family)